MKKLSMEQLNNTLGKALQNYDGSEITKSVIRVIAQEINERKKFKPFFS